MCPRKVGLCAPLRADSEGVGSNSHQLLPTLASCRDSATAQVCSRQDGVALGFGQAQPRLEPSGAWSLSCPATSNKTSRVIGSTQRAAERCGDRFLTHLASAWADSRSILPRRGFPWAKHGLWHVAHAIGHQGKARLACPRARRVSTSRLCDGGDITNLRVRNPKSVPTRKGGCMTPTIRATCSNATGAT